MALSTTSIAARFAELIKQLPVSVTFGGKTYTAARKELGAERNFYSYGADSGYSFSLVFAAAAFTTPPALDDKIVVEGKTYRVLKATLDAAGVALTVDLGGEYA